MYMFVAGKMKQKYVALLQTGIVYLVIVQAVHEMAMNCVGKMKHTRNLFPTIIAHTCTCVYLHYSRGFESIIKCHWHTRTQMI